MLLLAKQSLDEMPYKLSGAVAKLAGITFRRLAFIWSWPRPWPAPPMVRPALARLRLLFGLLEASFNIWMFGFCFVKFREYFLCNFSETQKQQKIGN
jgi:hypothetical protein